MTQFRPIRSLLLLLVLAVALPAQAAKPATTEAELVQRAESYLNGITTLRARFLQISPDGGAAEGVAYLSRPGHMRLDYLPPNPIQVFTDNGMLIYYDRQLQQTSYIDIDQTPAGVLVRPDIRLSGGSIAVTGVRQGRGTVEIDMVRARDPGAGELTLVFEAQPFALKQWRVRDAQNQVTTVSLFDTQTGIQLDPNLFRFVDPQFRNPIQNNR